MSNENEIGTSAAPVADVCHVAPLRPKAFSTKERFLLAVAIAVALVGTSAGALAPDRSAAAAKKVASSAQQHPCSTVPSVTPSAAATIPATAAAASASAPSAAPVSRTPSARRVARTATKRQAAAPKASTTAPSANASSAAPTVPGVLGLTVAFGRFGGSAVTWRVVEATDDEVVLLSDKVISAGAFETDWETPNANRYAASEVRRWLLDQFAPNAFSAEESATLLPHTGGAAGSDRVFLLSSDEVKRYLPKVADRKASARAEAAANPGYSGERLTLTAGRAAWWLADAGVDGAAKTVGADGQISSELVYYADLGVRPAIRVDREKIDLSFSAQGAD